MGEPCEGKSIGLPCETRFVSKPLQIARIFQEMLTFKSNALFNACDVPSSILQFAWRSHLWYGASPHVYAQTVQCLWYHNPSTWCHFRYVARMFLVMLVFRSTTLLNACEVRSSILQIACRSHLWCSASPHVYAQTVQRLWYHDPSTWCHFRCVTNSEYCACFLIRLLIFTRCSSLMLAQVCSNLAYSCSGAAQRFQKKNRHTLLA